MTTEHPSSQIFTDYLIGELPTREQLLFKRHLDWCSACTTRLEEYRSIFRVALPSIADEVAGEVPRGTEEWSSEQGEKRLHEAVREEDWRIAQHVPHAGGGRAVVSLPKPWTENRWLRLNVGVALAIAASLVAAVGLANSVYRLGVKHGMDHASAIAKVSLPSVPTSSMANDAALQEGFRKLESERDAVRASLLSREGEIGRLRTQIDQQRKQSEAAEASLRAAAVLTQQMSGQRDDLTRKLEEQQTVLAALQKKFDASQDDWSNGTLRQASLENQIQAIAQLLKEKDATIDEQQRLLTSDRDIRDLITARGMYMAEVYEVGGNGKANKPYGRVFYTRGKSLIFFGYDLDQQRGLKEASIFQAWGMRGPDKHNALNLGKMEYVDSAANRHWELRFDDPRALEQIDAVFVTVEPHGESRVPQGKEFLFAYLKEEPNHP